MINKMNSKQDCTICLETLGNNFHTTTCNHNFHTNCWEQWKDTEIYQQNHTCPLCRANQYTDENIEDIEDTDEDIDWDIYADYNGEAQSLEDYMENGPPIINGAQTAPERSFTLPDGRTVLKFRNGEIRYIQPDPILRPNHLW